MIRMDTQGFDDLIRAKMQALKVPENESAWAKFTEKEPEPGGSDEAFDELIKSKVYHIHPRFKWAGGEVQSHLAGAGEELTSPFKAASTVLG